MLNVQHLALFVKDVVALGLLVFAGETVGELGFMNLGACAWGGARHRMDHTHGLFSKLSEVSRPAKTTRALNNGQLRQGT